jgi:hypothetical protein
MYIHPQLRDVSELHGSTRQKTVHFSDTVLTAGFVRPLRRCIVFFSHSDAAFWLGNPPPPRAKRPQRDGRIIRDIHINFPSAYE